MADRPPEWELDMVLDVSGRWNISEEDAEVFLESVGAFGPRSAWVSEKAEQVDE